MRWTNQNHTSGSKLWHTTNYIIAANSYSISKIKLCIDDKLEISHTMQDSPQKTKRKQSQIQQQRDLKGQEYCLHKATWLTALKNLRVTYKLACLVFGNTVLLVAFQWKVDQRFFFSITAFSSHLLTNRKWNADATTIEVHNDGSGEFVCIVQDKMNRSNPTHGLGNVYWGVWFLVLNYTDQFTRSIFLYFNCSCICIPFTVGC